MNATERPHGGNRARGTTATRGGSPDARDGPARGLSSAEARRRLAEHGPNRLVPERRHRRGTRLVWRAVSDPMAVLLLVAAPTYLALGDRLEALVTFLALGPITAVGVALETRSEHALEQLAALVAPTATVRRDGRPTTIAAEEIVPGDVVTVREGDVVPADARVVAGGPILVDESALTGESVSVTKALGEDDRVAAGTIVVTGRAEAVVDETGPRTRYGRIGALVAQTRPTRTPLEGKVRRFVGTLTVLAVVFCGAVVATELARGNGWGDAVVAGVSLGIAAIPEEYLIVLTLDLAIGATRLARQHALVRRLPAVEALGATTVICTDKTGTLTRGRLAVVALATPSTLTQAGEPLAGDTRALLETAIWASEPDPYDPLDRALYDLGTAYGVLHHPGTLVRDHPFDAADRYATHVWSDGEQWRVAAKGAYEGLLRHAAVDGPDRARLEELHAQLAASGMRIIGVASGTTLAGAASRAEDEQALQIVGLVGFADPAREGIVDAISECRSAGIRVVMLTGDHPVTAAAVAESLRIGDGARVVTGADLDACGDDALGEVVAGTEVFARVQPEQKHRIVHALRARGEVVAMTGDGINDAPALREADIGVAFGGERGTEVARQAATLVLLDDNFTTIVRAVEGGRRIFDNLRHAFVYLAVFHAPLLLAALVVPLAGKPLLLLPLHMILLELLLHPIVALVFERDPAGADVMRRPPRPVDAGVLTRGEIARAFAIGAAVAAVVLGVYFAELARGGSAEHARAFGFATLLLSATALVFIARSSSRPVWRVNVTRNPILLPAVALLLGIVAIVFCVPAVRGLFDMGALHPVDWVLAATCALLATGWTEPFKRAPRASRTAIGDTATGGTATGATAEDGA